MRQRRPRLVIQLAVDRQLPVHLKSAQGGHGHWAEAAVDRADVVAEPFQQGLGLAH